MALVRWDPTREVDVLQNDMNRLFDAFFQVRGGNRAGGSAMQRWIRADLPGLSEDDIEIQVKDDVLTISGERKSEHQDSGEGFYRVERSFGRFSRSLDLPTGVDPAAVTAGFDNGVLEVRVPKPEERQPTKVQIGSRNGHRED